MRSLLISLAALAATAAAAFSAPAGAFAALDPSAATHLVNKRVGREVATIKAPTESARWKTFGCVAAGQGVCQSKFWMRFYRGGHRTMHCNGVAQVRQHKDGRLYIVKGTFGYSCLDG